MIAIQSKFLLRINKTSKSCFLFHFLFVFLIFYFLFFILGPDFVGAQEMTSEKFKIQGGNFNMSSGNISSSNFNLSDIVGENISNIFVSKGFVVQSGFQNLYMASGITLSVNPASVEFGNLEPNVPSVKNVDLEVSAGKSPGFIVKTITDHPLQSLSGAQIPDTACDIEDNIVCSLNTANRWSKTKSYGFGYRITSDFTPADFAKIDYYRPFPALERDEAAAVILESNMPDSSTKAFFTLKINVSNSQPVGTYQNTISFLAVPKI